MKVRPGRIIASVAGAAVCVVSYKAALEGVGFEMPDDLGRQILLSVSDVAACMVGSLGGILVYERVGRKR